MAATSKLDAVIALAQHRGFVFQAGEIYGGSRSAWDYGPLGTELKENIKNFIPLQIGLCGIESLPNTHKINLHPMNFYIFPYLHDNSDKKLIFDIY